ncbi:hypothetical protein [Nonomuraea dietziae]|uniref:hypothetical protein n=1 Tax=Nonomuraea dietziae TaxID=65515 RepID=UPI003425AB6A
MEGANIVAAAAAQTRLRFLIVNFLYRESRAIWLLIMTEGAGPQIAGFLPKKSRFLPTALARQAAKSAILREITAMCADPDNVRRIAR